MRKFGLIGGALGHSFSPGYFAKKFTREGITDARYDAYELGEIAEVEQLLQDPELVGFNVTIPYKRAILTYLTAIDPEAEAIGAVNTVHLTPEGPVGFNTDVTGFRDSLKPVLRSHHQRALILGTGGASAGVWHVLRHLGLQCIYVSRSPEGPDQVHYQDEAHGGRDGPHCFQQQPTVAPGKPAREQRPTSACWGPIGGFYKGR